MKETDKRRSEFGLKESATLSLTLNSERQILQIRYSNRYPELAVAAAVGQVEVRPAPTHDVCFGVSYRGPVSWCMTTAVVE